MLNKKQFWLAWVGYTCFIFLIMGITHWNPHVPFFEQRSDKAILQNIADTEHKFRETNKAVVFYIGARQPDSRLYFNDIKSIVDEQWVYVYKNKELIYWSTYQYVPQWKNIDHLNGIGVISDAKGKYLALRTSYVKDNALYDIVSLTPLSREYPIQNNYLKSGLSKKLFQTDKGRVVTHPATGYTKVEDLKGRFLFAYTLDENRDSQSSLIGIFLLLLLIVYFFWWYTGLKKWYLAGLKYRTEWQFILLFAFCMSYKIVAFLATKYYLLEGIPLFDATYFAYSSWSPSIGHYMINVLAAFVLSSFVYRHYSSFFLTKLLLRQKTNIQYVVVVILLIFSYGLFLEVYHTMDIIQRNSQSVFDITMSVDFDWLRVLSLLILLLMGLVYYYINHTIVRISIQVIGGYKLGLIASVVAMVFTCIIYVYLPELYLLPFIHTTLLLIVIYTGYMRDVSKMRYQAYLYFFLYAIEIAWILAFAVQGYYIEKLNRDKEKYYYQLFVDNDIQGEYLLHDALENISKDAYLKNILMSPFSDKQLIEQKIKKIHLSNYFDKFEVNILLFDASGKSYTDTTGKNDLDRYLQAVLLKKYSTQFKNIFLVEEPSQLETKKYYCFQPISHGIRALGYVVIELRYKKIQPNSVYPELLVDKKYRKNIPERSYNYAVYHDDKLIYSRGVINYYQSISKEDINFLKENRIGFFKNGFHHWATYNGEGNLIVVSSEANKIYVLITNFSFFFTCNVFLLLVLVSVNLLLFRLARKSVSYASRIQVYINIAFFVPLSIMSIVSLSVITNNYVDTLNKKITATADDISIQVSGILDQKKGKSIGWTQIQEKISDLSRYSDLDLNVYTNKGLLYYSNQQDIYKKEIISRLLNPQAYAAILEEKNQAILLNENIGELNFKMVYTAIRSQETGLVYGVLSIPFFESKNELNKEIIQVLNTIMNLFSFTFIALLVLSYFASRYLTYPLHMITQKLGRTSLTTENEPLQWKGDDEIGKLVNQYNTMLKVLEENKKILSRTEKESAWREMAKQVAHEIKNPLTPMKLSLQHLSRRIGEEDEFPKDHKDNLLKTIQSLLSQIDNLSDIAGSFSTFAKMPEPIAEDFDLTALVKSISMFHESSGRLTLVMEHDQSLIVRGDQGWMNNVLNNLIINAFQSVPEKRVPEVSLVYTFQGNSVLIAVKDNGNGIPEEIRDKVFQPNFSTKFAGSGIGLALAKRGVEYMGGRIWFETQTGKGTTFYIHIPL